jgi:hypothetical protein
MCNDLRKIDILWGVTIRSFIQQFNYNQEHNNLKFITMRAYKSRSKSRVVFLLSILAIFVISSLSSCMAHRGSGSWDDIGHARSFSHKRRIIAITAQASRTLRIIRVNIRYCVCRPCAQHGLFFAPFARYQPTYRSSTD